MFLSFLVVSLPQPFLFCGTRLLGCSSSETATPTLAPSGWLWKSHSCPPVWPRSQVRKFWSWKSLLYNCFREVDISCFWLLFRSNSGQTLAIEYRDSNNLHGSSASKGRSLLLEVIRFEGLNFASLKPHLDFNNLYGSNVSYSNCYWYWWLKDLDWNFRLSFSRTLQV